MQLDDTSYKVSSAVIQDVFGSSASHTGSAPSVNLTCTVEKFDQLGLVEYLASVEVFNYDGDQYDYRGNQVGRYVTLNFQGAGYVMGTFVSGGYGGNRYANIYSEIQATEQANPKNEVGFPIAPSLGAGKTVLGLTGYPVRIRKSTISAIEIRFLNNNDLNKIRNGDGPKNIDAVLSLDLDQNASIQKVWSPLKCAQTMGSNAQKLGQMFTVMGGVEKNLRGDVR